MAPISLGCRGMGTETGAGALWGENLAVLISALASMISVFGICKGSFGLMHPISACFLN